MCACITSSQLNLLPYYQLGLLENRTQKHRLCITVIYTVGWIIKVQSSIKMIPIILSGHITMLFTWIQKTNGGNLLRILTNSLKLTLQTITIKSQKNTSKGRLAPSLKHNYMKNLLFSYLELNSVLPYDHKDKFLELQELIKDFNDQNGTNFDVISNSLEYMSYVYKYSG